MEPAARWGPAIRAGLVGAATVTALNEVGRRVLPQAPRAELLGIRGVRALARLAGRRPPRGRRAYRWALAGEALSNGAYYALVGASPRRPLLAGAVLGAAAGLGAVALPGPLGLGERPTRRTRTTAALAFGWYALAGLAAGAAYRTIAARALVRPPEARRDPAYTSDPAAY